jgi:hypothetical protein
VKGSFISVSVVVSSADVIRSPSIFESIFLNLPENVCQQRSRGRACRIILPVQSFSRSRLCSTGFAPGESWSVTTTRAIFKTS